METTRPRRRIWLRRMLLLGAALLAVALIFKWWLGRRAGSEYYGAPETLLPPTTAAVATWRNLSGFLDDVTRLGAFEKIRGEEDAVAMLVTSSAWRKIEREKDKARYKIITALMGDFVRRWFGREFTLAVVEPERRPSGRMSSSGLIAIARTDLGFEEQLAELVAHLYPELSLEERPYRGRTIYRYNAEKSKRAFSYCRLGKTVAVSIRSPAWAWLEGLIDRSLGSDAEGRPLESLAEDEAFRDSAESRRADEGIGMFVQPARLKTAFLSMPANISDDPEWLFWLDYAEGPLSRTEWGALRLTLREGLRLDSFWKVRPKPAADSLPSPDARASAVDDVLRALPAETAVLAVAESPRLRETFLDIRDRMANSEVYAESLEAFEAAWRDTTGIDFRGDVLEPMGPATGAALTGMSASLLLPLPETFFWWEYASPEAAREEAALLARENPSGRIVPSTIPCQWTFAAQGRNLVVRQVNGGGATTAPPGGRGLLDHPLLAYRSEPEGARPVLCLFANFESAHGHLERLQRLRAAAALWSEGMRQDVAEWETILAAMRHLHGLRLTATPRAEGVDVNLLITVD